MSSAKNFFSEEEQEAIINAIKSAELNTSGEIRLHLEDRTSKDPMLRAEEVFLQTGMQKTEKRNGVLIYLSVKDRKLAILGDKGINDLVGDDFWKEEKDLMLQHFKQEKYVDGLTKAIAVIGENLKKYFPYQKGDENELPDDISFNES